MQQRCLTGGQFNFHQLDLTLHNNNIGVYGITVIINALEQSGNDILFCLYAKQYGFVLPQTLCQRIDQRIDANIQKQYSVNREVFTKEHFRFLKYYRRIQHIDSIYRNKM